MLDIPVFSVVAFSGTGKTTMLEQLVRELKSRGIRLAVVKHDAHRFEIDKEGKDSWRMSRAGADTVAIVSAERAAIMENRPVSFESVIERICDVDLIITEGYKTGDYPKLALRRAETGNDFAVDPATCFAVMSDTATDCGTPSFALDDISGVADLVVATFLRK